MIDVCNLGEVTCYSVVHKAIEGLPRTLSRKVRYRFLHVDHHLLRRLRKFLILIEYNRSIPG